MGWPLPPHSLWPPTARPMGPAAGVTEESPLPPTPNLTPLNLPPHCPHTQETSSTSRPWALARPCQDSRQSSVARGCPWATDMVLQNNRGPCAWLRGSWWLGCGGGAHAGATDSPRPPGVHRAPKRQPPAHTHTGTRTDTRFPGQLACFPEL